MGQNDEEKSARKHRRARPETFVASTRVTKPMMDAMDEIIEKGNYLRVSDYLRELIRKDLASRSVEV